MNVSIKNISSLEKIRSVDDLNVKEINSVKLFKGERYSYQVVLSSENLSFFKIELESEISEYVSAYIVKDAVMDMVKYPNTIDTNFIADEPGVMPDILVPLEEQKQMARIHNGFVTVWINVCLPEDIKPGKYHISCVAETVDGQKSKFTPEIFRASKNMYITVEDAVVPVQSTLFTQWFHADCVATAHKVEIFSEAHWELLDKYIKMAADSGINLILTPVITPPLDTAYGTRRPCVQLTGVEYIDGKYSFDFSKLGRWIAICKKHGINHFEICQLFSQWGIEFTPNILVKENGEEYFKFGWHVKANDESYREFLEAFIPSLVDCLKAEGVFENCYFHISDEPSKEHLENYTYARNLLKPLIGNAKTMDALSNIDFCEAGLVDCPVCAIDHIMPFVEKNVKNLWGYYCCGQFEKVSNRFLSMPMWRNRIIGLQIYKFNLQGFLQWGYNFYFSQYSLYEINPYVTSCADGGFPSGDSFSVYPGANGPLSSTRAVVFREALQDVELCKMLEAKIGRKKAIEFIENEAGMEITFEDYPHGSEFIPGLMAKIKDIVAEN